MSDHGHHDLGGHELEAINTKLLFRLLFSLGFITFLACVAVVQWFNSQRRELQHRNAVAGSFMLKAHEEKMAEQLAGIDRVAADVAANPALLAAPNAPAGWIHPDDLVGGPAPAPKPAEQPAPAPEDAPVPVELPEPAKQDAPAEPAEQDAPAEPADKGEKQDDGGDKQDDKGEKQDDKKEDKKDKKDDESDGE